jgi:hypothetical protein
MIARVRFRHPSSWWNSHPHLPDQPAFEIYESLTGLYIDIDTNWLGKCSCDGRTFLLTEESATFVRDALGGCFLLVKNLITCEHAIEIGD